MVDLEGMGLAAKRAARELATTPTEVKNAALGAMAEALRAHEARILERNKLDLEDGVEAGLSAPLLDRLTLNPARIEGMAKGLEAIASFRDPIGEVLGMWTAEKGIRVGRVRVPLGVVGVIYEARPNVTADAA